MLSITTIPQPVTEHAISLTQDEYVQLSVVDQLRRAFSPGHRLGALIGAAIGGFVPTASYVIVHYEAVADKWLWVLVAGALCSRPPAFTHGRPLRSTLASKVPGSVS